MRFWQTDRRLAAFILCVALLVTLLAYLPGRDGGYVFDDYPNIVDNPGVKPDDMSLGSLARVALSSPSSEFKRPLASLTFAANYLATGDDPEPMKVTNIVIHLLNGLAWFFVMRLLLRLVPVRHERFTRWPGAVAALTAASWLLLPINFTCVLYIVQRMESLANLFVLFAIWAYLSCRVRMQRNASPWPFAGALLSMTLLPLVGLAAKETAVLTPLYTFIIEVLVFRGRSLRKDGLMATDKRIAGTYAFLLFLPMVIGLAWLLPGLLNGNAWARRDFTLGTRLLSELRIVLDYVAWTIVPTPSALSFYHDAFVPSTSLFSPLSTLASALGLLAMGGLAFACRRRAPLVTLGIALFFAGQVLTATIIPLELVYEHRNYFPSMGLLLAIIPVLVPERGAAGAKAPLAMARVVGLGALMVLWAGLTAMTAQAWSNPLGVALEIASRAPDSPRAQYELGRAYVILSRYDVGSPFAARVYAPLERAAALPQSSILPEQALIFFNARTHRPLPDAWWDSIVAKLRRRKPGVQDESALSALGSCQLAGLCDLPRKRMVEAYEAAMDYPRPSARLQAMYADYVLGVLGDRARAVALIRGAVKSYPEEPTYHITLTRLLDATGDRQGAQEQLRVLEKMNIGGSLDRDIASLRKLLAKEPSRP